MLVFLSLHRRDNVSASTTTYQQATELSLQLKLTATFTIDGLILFASLIIQMEFLGRNLGFATSVIDYVL